MTTNKKPWFKGIPLFRTTSLGRRISAIGLSISELLLVLARDVRRPALQNHVLFHRRLQTSFFGCSMLMRQNRMGCRQGTESLSLGPINFHRGAISMHGGGISWSSVVNTPGQSGELIAQARKGTLSDPPSVSYLGHQLFHPNSILLTDSLTAFKYLLQSASYIIAVGRYAVSTQNDHGTHLPPGLTSPHGLYSHTYCMAEAHLQF